MDYLNKQSQAYREQVQAPMPGNSTGRAAKNLEPKSVLLIDYHLFIPFLKKRLQEEGFIVQCVKPAELTVQRFDQLCAILKPSFILGVNFSGEIAFLASQRQIPYVSWTIDPLSDRRLSLIPGTNSSYCLAYAHRRKLVKRLQQIGIANARYMPLAAPGDMRKPVDEPAKLNPYRCPVSFVGNALVDEHTVLIESLQKCGADASLTNRILEFLEEFTAKEGDRFDFNGFSEDGSNIPGWLKDSLKNRMTLPEVAELLDGKLSSLLRIRRVQTLEPLGIKVYGRKDWANVIKNYYGVADHGEELTCIYNASEVNLDIPRVYQRDIVTMRVFDILASGGLLFSEPSADLLQLFEDGRHLVTYRDTEELVKRLKDFQKQPGAGKEIAASGRKEVLAKHLIQHRFQKIMADIELWKSRNAKTGS